MGKLFFIVILVIAVIVGAIALLSQTASKSSPYSDLSLQNPTPTPIQAHVQQEQQNTAVTPVPQVQEPIGPLPATMSATISTSKGDIALTLYRSDAPIAVQNFVNKAKSGFYKGLIFHRVEDWVIQGGDPTGTGTGGNDMPTELNQKSFVAGSLGVAAHPGADGKNINNDAQFFITKTDASWLNGQYTNFGIVTAGMDVVSKIAIGDKILGITIAQ